MAPLRIPSILDLFSRRPSERTSQQRRWFAICEKLDREPLRNRAKWERPDGVRESCAPYLEGIHEELGGDREIVAAVLGHPADFQIVPTHENREEQDFITCGVGLAAAYAQAYPCEATAGVLVDRLRWILEDPTGGEIPPASPHQERDVVHRFLFPNAEFCHAILVDHLGMPGVAELLCELYRGDYRRELVFELNGLDHHIEACKEFFSFVRNDFDRAAAWLFAEGRLPRETLVSALRLVPSFVAGWRVIPDERDRSNPPEFAQARALDAERDADYLAFYAECGREAFDLACQQLPESALWFRNVVGRRSAEGIAKIAAGLRVIEGRGLKPKDLKGYGADRDAILYLIGIRALAEGEDVDALVAALGEFKRATLTTALPYAAFARAAILKALGWEALIPLQARLFEIAGGNAALKEPLAGVPNSDDPSVGIVDRAPLCALLEELEPKMLADYFKAMKNSDVALGNAIALVKACQGVERAAIEKKLAKHGQIAIKAWGLYAVESPEELRERYRRFKAMHKEASSYGAERQANTRAAVEVGLANLAQAAGFPDVARLEWQLESEISEALAPFDEWVDALDWQIRLTMVGITPRIEAARGGKPLKSLPAKVRKTESHARLRETQEIVKDQARRFRSALETMMCSGEWIESEALALMNSLACVRALLGQLVMRTSDGQLGLFREPGHLEGVDGASLAYEGPIGVAHPKHLVDADALIAWQRRIVEREGVQPFKQCFRELYLLTPAELDTRDHSLRFAGQCVDGGVARRLFQSRGWQLSRDGEIDVHKRFDAHGFSAQVMLSEYGHYFGERDAPLDAICFSRTDARGRASERVELAQIDPLVFSEVMRDLDLVVSVAQVDEVGHRWSPEMAEMRARVVTELLSKLQMKQVHCKEPFAYVEGKLAKYRIHLGSGAIHVDPGNYLCIVPAPAADRKAEPLYLPFADSDRKMAEILSKIFLLCADDEIEDPTILAQIQR